MLLKHIIFRNTRRSREKQLRNTRRSREMLKHIILQKL